MWSFSPWVLVSVIVYALLALAALQSPAQESEKFAVVLGDLFKVACFLFVLDRLDQMITILRVLTTLVDKNLVQ